MQRTAAAILLVLACAPPAPAQAPTSDSGKIWIIQKTTDGCIFYDQRRIFDGFREERGFKEIADDMRSHIKSAEWSGTPCTPGQPISGRGTLMSVWQTESGIFEHSYAGAFVDGVPNGNIEFSRKVTLFGLPNGRIEEAVETKAVHFRMGCPDDGPPCSARRVGGKAY